MKDQDMRQGTIDAAQTALEEAIKQFKFLEKQSCDDAIGSKGHANGNALITEALGYLLLAKGRGTQAVLAVGGDTTVQFGGK